MARSSDNQHLRFIAEFREEYSKIKWENDYENTLRNIGTLEELLERISDEISVVLLMDDPDLRMKLIEVLEGMTSTLKKQQETGFYILERLDL